MSIICTCGHKVEDYDDTATIVLKRYCDRNGPYISYVVYCKPCADEENKLGNVLHSDKDIDDWLNSYDRP
jgi:hypothetical protein